MKGTRKGGNDNDRGGRRTEKRGERRSRDNRKRDDRSRSPERRRSQRLQKKSSGGQKTSENADESAFVEEYCNLSALWEYLREMKEFESIFPADEQVFMLEMIETGNVVDSMSFLRAKLNPAHVHLLPEKLRAIVLKIPVDTVVSVVDDSSFDRADSSKKQVSFPNFCLPPAPKKGILKRPVGHVYSGRQYSEKVPVQQPPFLDEFYEGGESGEYDFPEDFSSEPDVEKLQLQNLRLEEEKKKTTEREQQDLAYEQSMIVDFYRQQEKEVAAKKDIEDRQRKENSLPFLEAKMTPGLYDLNDARASKDQVLVATKEVKPVTRKRERRDVSKGSNYSVLVAVQIPKYGKRMQRYFDLENDTVRDVADWVINEAAVSEMESKLFSLESKFYTNFPKRSWPLESALVDCPVEGMKLAFMID